MMRHLRVVIASERWCRECRLNCSAVTNEARLGAGWRELGRGEERQKDAEEERRGDVLEDGERPHGDETVELEDTEGDGELLRL